MLGNPIQTCLNEWVTPSPASLHHWSTVSWNLTRSTVGAIRTSNTARTIFTHHSAAYSRQRMKLEANTLLDEKQRTKTCHFGSVLACISKIRTIGNDLQYSMVSNLQCNFFYGKSFPSLASIT
jgi:hypothetical protein